jgi:rare lipoprotein A
MIRRLAPLLVLILAACGAQPPRPVAERTEAPAAQPASPPVARPAPARAAPKGGGYYKDDGPGDAPPEDLAAIPDAVPRAEPLHRFANNPYSALGHDFVPMKTLRPYRASGVASWYGRRYHGQKTSSGEAYDMYGMTAAHPILPIPSYVRVTNPANGRSVVVRVNDRGPFHAGRLIDLSYTAAWKLDIIGKGSGFVEVESVLPGQEAPAAGTTPAPEEEDPIARFASAPPPLTFTAAGDAADGRGHYLQLGAFGSRDNAESLRLRLAGELGALGGKLLIQSAGGLHRVQLGPWSDGDEARRAAARVAELLEFKPVVVQR